jgi:hypothetical protein
MFKRRLRWFGKLRSDEGFALAYGHKSITYEDERGSFQFGLEDGFLFPESLHQVAGDTIELDSNERNKIVERVMDGIRSEGHSVQLYSKEKHV